MTERTTTGDLHGVRYEHASMRDARFVEVDLRGVVMRGVDLAGGDLDAPWLLDGESTLLVNGVDVAPLVEAELCRRMPGRALRRAPDPEGLREAWRAVEDAWAAAVRRAEGMPGRAVDVSVDGEWSFAQTLRHLVMATDTWLRGAILGIERPFHPIGQPDGSYAAQGGDAATFSETSPEWSTVLAVRADRVGMVRDLLASIDADGLAAPRRNPWEPAREETVRSCIHVILEEEWEHLRFALRDLVALDEAAAG
ncbi:DinB family protein [Agrococcus versicolor]|uniref:DinB family protein n=1 Tax=Agrococcus versicolor TaxID=501482 RepID=A0ABP5MJ43_9MICO